MTQPGDRRRRNRGVNRVSILTAMCLLQPVRPYFLGADASNR